MRAQGLPLALLIFCTLIQTASLIGLYSVVAGSMFHKELSSGWLIGLWAFGLGIPLSLFEYLFHRYLLHSALVPFLASMHRSHRTHHDLTYVKAPVNPREPSKPVPVRSEFPIEHSHQEESMMFPLYSTVIFSLFFVLTLGLPLKLLLPGAPIILALLIAVPVYLVFYEVWHAILHMPLEKFWQPLMDSKWSSKPIRRLYGFHLMHHWRPNANLAIVGFWGFAVWDHVFRTYSLPERIPLEGQSVTFEDSVLPGARWPISAIDKISPVLFKASRRLESFLGRVFLRR